jgi:hypothetical protein
MGEMVREEKNIYNFRIWLLEVVGKMERVAHLLIKVTHFN